MTPSEPGCCHPRYSVFDERVAREELETYREKGPDAQNRELLAALASQGVAGATAVDIGAGVGILGHGLVAAGAARVTDVDGTPAFLAAARDEAARRGSLDRWTFLEGDYVTLADDIGPVEVTTLGRVLCCYADWRELVEASTARTQRLYGVVYPVSRWWLRLAATLVNPVARLTRRRMRLHVHPDREVDAAIRAAGFRRIHASRGLIWQTILYRRLAT